MSFNILSEWISLYKTKRLDFGQQAPTTNQNWSWKFSSTKSRKISEGWKTPKSYRVLFMEFLDFGRDPDSVPYFNSWELSIRFPADRLQIPILLLRLFQSMVAYKPVLFAYHITFGWKSHGVSHADDCVFWSLLKTVLVVDVSNRSVPVKQFLAKVKMQGQRNPRGRKHFLWSPKQNREPSKSVNAFLHSHNNVTWPKKSNLTEKEMKSDRPYFP